MEEQDVLRSRVLAERRALPREVVQEASLAIQRKFLTFTNFTRAKVIALYRAFWNEVSTELIAKQAQTQGCQLLYPIVTDSNMSFVTETTNSEMSLNKIDIVVVPGVVFDTTRHRIGLGKGFYDRTLAHFQGQKIALAYDFQVLEKIPFKRQDLVCDQVITELRQLSS